MGRLIVENFAELHLEEAALLFYYQDGFQALGELFYKHGIQREGHADFPDTDSVADLEVAEGLHQVVISFPGAEDAHARRGAILPIHGVQSCELPHRF